MIGVKTVSSTSHTIRVTRVLEHGQASQMKIYIETPRPPKFLDAKTPERLFELDLRNNWNNRVLDLRNY